MSDSAALEILVAKIQRQLAGNMLCIVVRYSGRYREPGPHGSDELGKMVWE
jgi:hypothetical protein